MARKTIDISDAVYDMLEDELRRRNPNHPRLRQVGITPRRMGKVKLPFWMGSLDKLKPNTVDKWLKNNPGPYVISDKMDGVSLGLDQEDLETKLYTRGNGMEGQDVSHLVPFLRKAKKIPKKIPSGMQIRCEVEMTEATFKKYFPEGKNARNTVSGLLGQKEIDINFIKRMDIIAYELVKPSVAPSQQLKRLEALGFKVSPWGLVKNIDSGALSRYLLKRKEKSRYAIDGIVIYLDKKEKRATSGNPKYARAFKMMVEGGTAIVKVVAVHWNLSKHSYYKPRIEIEPTTLSGVTITYLTGFNGQFIKDNKIGPGSELKIVRSGDVIPHILEVTKKSRTPQMPSKDYEWNSTGVDIYAPGAKSTTVILKNITNFFTSIGVEGFKQRTIERLYKAGYDTVPKIILITEEELLKIPGIQTKSAEKLRGEIDSAISGVEVHKLAFGSGTFGRTMGSRRLKEIFTHFPSMYKKAYKKESVIEAVKALPGYKEKTASDFAEGLPKFLKFLRDLPKSVKIIEPKKLKKSSSRLEGEVIVFTGFRNSEWQNIIEKNGGEVGNSVSRKTTLLVAKDIHSESGKVRKATDLGIEVMDMEGFRRYLDKKVGISI